MLSVFDTFLSELVLAFLLFSAPGALLLKQTTGVSLHSPHTPVSHYLYVVSLREFLLSWITSGRYWPLQTGNTPQRPQPWKCFNASKPSQMALIKIGQIPSRTYISCFKCLNFEDKMCTGACIDIIPSTVRHCLHKLQFNMPMLVTSPVSVHNIMADLYPHTQKKSQLCQPHGPP